MRTTKLLLFWILGVVLFMCIGTVGISFYYLTRDDPPPETPGQAVVTYLTAVYDKRDESVAAEAACPGDHMRQKTREAIDEVRQIEQRIGQEVRAAWTLSPATKDGKQASFTVQLTLEASIDGGAQRDPRTLAVDAVREDHWRVCDIRRTDQTTIPTEPTQPTPPTPVPRTSS